jgi:hypothetical protein
MLFVVLKKNESILEKKIQNFLGRNKMSPAVVMQVE